MITKFILSCVLFLFISLAHTDVLVETRFGDRESLVPIENTAEGRITGVLPDNVLEDSAWSAIEVEYTFEEDALGGGLGWIEAQLKSGERGQAQLKWLLPHLTEPGRYRLDLLLAGADNAAVTFAIRSTAPPYTAHWEQILRPGAFREPQTLDFALPAIEGDVALIAHMGRRGTLYFYNLSLSRRSEADLAAERAERLADAPANLLPAAGFALGLPSGWSTGARDSRRNDVRVQPAAEPGPNGTVPLRFASRREGHSVTLASAPVEPLLRDEPHTVTFNIRGTVRDGNFAVQADDRTLASTILPTSPDEWTPVSLSFTPDLTAPWHILTWSLDGDIEIDALHVTVDAADTLPTSDNPELALTGHPMRNHVFLRGIDTEIIAFGVTNAASGDSLHLTAHDLRGRTAELPPAELDGSLLQRGTLSFEDIFPDHPYGPLRIEGRILRDGEPISPPVERVIHRLRPPRYWGQRAPQSRFGTHINLFEPHLHSMKAIGINWVRLHGPNGRFVYWSAVEPRQGEWQFHRDAIQQYLDADMEIVGSWLHTPGWARIERQDKGGWLDNWWQPRDYNEFAEYVRRITAAHADQITHWQIWNEPWGDFWIGAWRPELGPRNQWHAGDTPAEDFARLSRIAYTAGKSVSSDIQVLGVNATVGERGKHWMRKMLELDVERHSDIVTYHAYTGGGLRGILSPSDGLLPRLNASVLDPLRNKPGSMNGRALWLTEGTALQRGHDTGLLHHTINGNVDDPALLLETRQALVVYHLLNFAQGVEKIFNYAPNATGTFFRRFSGIYWGALTHPGGELTPASAAFSTMAWHLEETTFSHHSVSDSGIHCFIFRRNGTPETVAALVAQNPLPAPVQLPEDPTLRFEDLFGNPIPGQDTNFAELIWVTSPTPPEALHQALTDLLRKN